MAITRSPFAIGGGAGAGICAGARADGGDLAVGSSIGGGTTAVLKSVGGRVVATGFRGGILFMYEGVKEIGRLLVLVVLSA